jgi:hypothetical protein
MFALNHGSSSAKPFSHPVFGSSSHVMQARKQSIHVHDNFGVPAVEMTISL